MSKAITGMQVLYVRTSEILSFLTEACEFYERSAPTVHDYLDGLFRRVENDASNVRLSELYFITDLKCDGEFLQPNYAANAVYKIMQRLGMDTTGHIGF